MDSGITTMAPKPRAPTGIYRHRIIARAPVVGRPPPTPPGIRPATADDPLPTGTEPRTHRGQTIAPQVEHLQTTKTPHPQGNQPEPQGPKLQQPAPPREQRQSSRKTSQETEAIQKSPSTTSPDGTTDDGCAPAETRVTLGPTPGRSSTVQEGGAPTEPAQELLINTPNQQQQDHTERDDATVPEAPQGLRPFPDVEGRMDQTKFGQDRLTLIVRNHSLNEHRRPECFDKPRLACIHQAPGLCVSQQLESNGWTGTQINGRHQGRNVWEFQHPWQNGRRSHPTRTQNEHTPTRTTP